MGLTKLKTERNVFIKQTRYVLTATKEVECDGRWPGAGYTKIPDIGACYAFKTIPFYLIN